MSLATDLPAGFAELRTASYGVLLDVVELHAPSPARALRVGGPVTWWECKGCDPGTYADDPPEWPCSTVNLIAEKLHVSLS